MHVSICVCLCTNLKAGSGRRSFIISIVQGDECNNVLCVFLQIHQSVRFTITSQLDGLNITS